MQIKIKYCIILCTFLLPIYISCQAKQIEKIKKNNLQAFTFEEEDWPNEPFGDFLNRCMDYQEYMQPFKKRRIAWNILERYYKSNFYSAQNILDNDVTTWRNLQLLSGDEDHINLYLAAQVDRTQTEIGSVLLHQLIAQPTDNVGLLQKRQNIVRYLLENEDFYEAINALLEQFKKSENLFLSFLTNDPFKNASKKHYFNFYGMPAVEKFFNQTPSILTTSTLLSHQKRILTCCMTLIASGILPVYGLHKLFTKSLNDYQNSSVNIDAIAERFVGCGGPVLGSLSLIENNVLNGLTFITAGAYCLSQFPSEQEWMRDNFSLIMHMQKKLHHVKNCFNTIAQVGKIIDEHTDFEYLNDFNVSQFFQEFQTATQNSQQFFHILSKKTFDNESSLIADWGSILVAYQLMHEQAYDLNELLYALGQLDVYMSIARLIKEYKQKSVHFTFAHYLKSSQHPIVSCQNMWNPFINDNIVIANSFTLGLDNQPQNMILTGPNEGGKSTFIKSAGIAIILSQSLGIAPADEFSLTPFSYVATYLNITDQYGKSLFQTQVERMKEIVDRLDNIKNHEYGFIIIDELFNGTDAKVGQAASCSIADYISQKPHISSIFSTHFPKMTTLANETNFINYKVIAEIDTTGKIIYPFTIYQGASVQNIVFDIMKHENFNETIIKNAQDNLDKFNF